MNTERERDTGRTPAAPVDGLSIVVPVYNSEGSLGPLVARLEPVLRRIAREYELVLINDGSRDGSWRAVQALAARHPWIRGIDMMRNYGQHNALLCGIRAARFPLTATIDDDLQHPPEVLPTLLRAMREDGADVVYGAPKREPHGLLRGLASQVTKVALQGAMGAASARHVSALRVFRTDLREAFAGYSSPLLSIDVLLTWGTARFTYRRVRHDPRTIGVSNYTVGKLVTHALNMVTGFSTLPLRAASVMGFGFALFGAAMLAYVLGRFVMFGTPVQGFPFLASSIAIFSGAQLFAIGVIGEYLARMFQRSMGRPVYVVRETTGAAPQ